MGPLISQAGECDTKKLRYLSAEALIPSFSLSKLQFGMTASRLLLPQLPSAKVTCCLPSISPPQLLLSIVTSLPLSMPIKVVSGVHWAVACWPSVEEEWQTRWAKVGRAS